MPLDPAISLQVQGPAPGGLMGGNPLDTIARFAYTQNALNQNRLFQQTFAARQKAGQILAASPDLETGLRNLYADPLTAPFAPEIASSVKQGMLAQTRQMGELESQALKGFGDALKALPGAVANPAAFDQLVSAYTGMVSPQVRDRVAGALANIRSSLTDGLPSDPQAAQAEMTKRWAGLATSAGLSPDVYGVAAGKPTEVTTGTGTEIGLTRPGQAGLELPGGTTTGFVPQQSIQVGPYGPGGAQQPTLVTGTNPLALPGPSAFGPSAGAPRTGGMPSGPSMQEQGYLESSGKKIADMQADMNQRVAGIPGALNRYDLMSNALQQFQSGGWAQMRGQFGSFLQGLKNAGASFVTQDMIDKVANQNLSEGQVFDALIKPTVIGELKDAAQGTGRVMRSEVDSFLRMMDMSKDPAALMKLLNQARTQLQIGYDQATKFPEFKNLIATHDPSVKGMDLSDYMPWYVKNYSQKALPMTTGAGMNIGPVPEGSAKGAGAQGPVATKRYVPGKGLVPITGQ